MHRRCQIQYKTSNEIYAPSRKTESKERPIIKTIEYIRAYNFGPQGQSLPLVQWRLLNL